MIKRFIKDKTIVVWFSCGAASAVALKKTIEVYGKNNKIVAVNNPIKNEHPDNQRFLKDCEDAFNIKIEFCKSKKYPSQDCNDVWKKRRFMSGPTGAPCTQELKRFARREWEMNNPFDYLVLGFTCEEKRRSDSFKKFERANMLSILIDLKITKEDCYRIVHSWGVDLPEMYKLGYPNANCIGCVKATSPTYWNHVRKQHPEVFKERSDLSDELGAKLVILKGIRTPLSKLPPDAEGRPLKSMKFECGLFCEEFKEGDDDDER